MSSTSIRGCGAKIEEGRDPTSTRPLAANSNSRVALLPTGFSLTSDATWTMLESLLRLVSAFQAPNKRERCEKRVAELNIPFLPLPLSSFTGVDGVDVVIGTSSFLREFSHGKDMAYIEKTAIEGELGSFVSIMNWSS